MLRSDRVSGSILYGLTLLLGFALPFEVIRPVLSTPWFVFTTLELLVIATVIAWSAHLLVSSSPRSSASAALRSLTLHSWPSPAWFALLFLGLAMLSAVLAPFHQGEALKFVARLAAGLYAFFLSVYVICTSSRLAGLLWAIVLGAGLSGLLGLGEFAGWLLVDPLLLLFQESPTFIGGQLRASASFQYATIAAMFFEMAVPLALALSATSGDRATRWPALAIALLGTINVVLTLSRAGMATLALAFALMLVLAWTRPRFRPLAFPVVLAGLALVTVVGVLTLGTTTFRTRLTTQNDLDWYNATYMAPSSLTLQMGESITATVEARNTGSVTWRVEGDRSFALGYYWLDGGGKPLRIPHVEVSLFHDVAPGETARLQIPLRTSLPPGDYYLAWGMLQRNILWFRHRNVPEARTAVHIEPGAEAPVGPLPTAETAPPEELPALPPTVERLDLWRVAFRMWLERPLLGFGPDTFRHLYGRYLGLADWDDRLHANNLYLEILADLGIAGALAFAGMVLAVLVRLVNALRRWQAGPEGIWAAGLGCSLLAFFIHGLLDYFLEFASLYLLFWMLLGLATAVTSGPLCTAVLGAQVERSDGETLPWAGQETGPQQSPDRGDF